VTQFSTKLETKFGPSQRADMMGPNALRFLGFHDDCGKPSAKSRNAIRLRSFYGDTPQPAWLALT
jgi:hypothetical protein